MESRENKLIADKLNSLDTLPAGYEPNLDAKWALLEAAEEKRKTVFFLFPLNKWMGVAACLLLFLLGGVVWMYRPTQEKRMNTVNTNHVVMPVAKSVAESLVNPEPIKDKLSEVVKPAVKNKSIREKKTEEALPVAVINPPVFDTVVESTKEITAGHQSVAEVKNKKQRYIQVDFDDNILPPEKNVVAQTFKIKFGLRNGDTYSQDLQNRATVKLKQNF